MLKHIWQKVISYYEKRYYFWNDEGRVNKMSKEIKYTENLNVFKYKDENRELDKTHIKKLMFAIEQNNLLQYNAILVDQDMNVLDGQHRLAAAAELGLGVWYQIIEETTPDTMIILNTSNKNWTMLDYCNYWSKLGRKQYDIVKNISKSTGLGVGIILSILSRFSNAKFPHLDTTSLKPTNYKKGLMEFVPEILPEVMQFIREIVQIREYLDFNCSTYFIAAYYRAREHEGWMFSRFIDALSKHKYEIKKCTTSREYAYQIEAAYNYKRKNRIEL